MDRRQFLFGAGACALAVGAGVNLRQVPFLWGDGIHDDTEALNAFFRGERVETTAGVFAQQNSLVGGVYRLSDTVRLPPNEFTVSNIQLDFQDLTAGKVGIYMSRGSKLNIDTPIRFNVPQGGFLRVPD